MKLIALFALALWTDPKPTIPTPPEPQKYNTCDDRNCPSPGLGVPPVMSREWFAWMRDTAERNRELAAEREKALKAAKVGR